MSLQTMTLQFLLSASPSAFSTLHLLRGKPAQIWISKQYVNSLDSVYLLLLAKQKQQVESIALQYVCVTSFDTELSQLFPAG